MDKEHILRIIGELYLNNTVLTEENAALRGERDQLRLLVEQLSASNGNGPQ